MSQQEFQNKLKCGIGRVHLSLYSSNAFPLIGEQVDLRAITRWAQEVAFTKLPGVGESEVVDVIENTTQETLSQVTILGEGELEQRVVARNFDSEGLTELFTTSKAINLYAMGPQLLPYHDVAVSSEISRTDQDFSVIINSDNGYDLSRDHSMSVYILKENGSVDVPEDIVALLTNEDFTLSDNVLTSSSINIPTRGIYDVETIIYDTLEHIEIGKRINKLITITPRLAARPTAGQTPFDVINGDGGTQIQLYKTGVNDLYATFETPNLGYYGSISLCFPSGYDAYTLVLSKPYEEDDNVTSKFRFTGEDTGTPQYTYDNPLVITIDSPTPIEFHGSTYQSVNYDADIRNTVWDGRGYYNLHYGIRFTKNPVTLEKPVTCMMLYRGTSDVELFELEMTDVSFCPIMAKTDPLDSQPQYWRGNFEQANFRYHHVWTHDTDSEGCYLGYFSNETNEVVYTGVPKTFTNLAGEEVTYTTGNMYPMQAHALPGFRMYRCIFERTGYDGAQISNATGEVCYNTFIGCAYREASGQTSGLSIQSFGGKCYNNILIDCHGPNFQIGLEGPIDLFNNIAYSKYGGPAIQFLFSYDQPELENSGWEVRIYNNIIATPGLFINGRNTIQVPGVHTHDNIIGYNGVFCANMWPITLETWENQAVNNHLFSFDEAEQKFTEYKMADYENADFRIAHNSSLVDEGSGVGFLFDYRGYRNWFQSTYPIGPFMGKYKNPLTIDTSIRLRGIVLTLISSVQLQVSINMEYVGTVTHYRVGENADLSEVDWLVWPDGDITYSFSSPGEKVLYAQIKNEVYESLVVSDAISIADPGDKAIVSIGWEYGEIPGSSLFDETHLISLNRFEPTPVVIYGQTGLEFGTLTRGEVTHPYHGEFGMITGDDSGIYPDEILKHNICYTGTIGTRDMHIEVPAGTYKVRLFVSRTGSCPPERVIYKIISGATEQEFIRPADYAIQYNLTQWQETTISVEGNNGFDIEWGIIVEGSYLYVPINIISIERI